MSDDEWRSMDTAPRCGRMVELQVDYTDGHGSLIDDFVGETIGVNLADEGEPDNWRIIGWDWCHDCFTEGHGRLMAWRPTRLNNGDEHG